MDKELREKTLKSLANSSMGDALIDYLEEQIASLIDATDYPDEGFEIEGKARVRAAETLRRVIRKLERKKQDTKTKTNNYV